MRNHDKYQQEISLNSAAGVGVMFTRTREPFRCIDALYEIATAKALPFGVWNVRDGWVQKSPTTEKGKPDGVVDVYKALKMIMDVDGGGHLAWPNGIYVMHAVHHWLGKHPGMLECLRHYVRDFSQRKNLRLILVCPEGEMLPDELVHDIPIVDYDLPDNEELTDIYNYILESVNDGAVEDALSHNESQVHSIVSSSAGMTQMEAEVAISKAVVENKPKSGQTWNDVGFSAFNGTILKAKTEVVKQSEVLELMPSVPLKQLGGLENYKEWIKTVAACLTPEAIAAGVDKAKGVAVVGPGGTGKTLLGKVTGTVLQRPLVRVDISKCFAGIVGQSEGKARAAIKQLEAMAPVVALIDEVDKALGGSHKGGGDSGVSQRVLGIFLTAMQESKADIFWILTANRVNNLPSEMLRKGRLDEVFGVLPPNRAEREAIFKIHLKKRLINPADIDDLDLAIDMSNGYVSAEIEAAVKEAKKVSFQTGEEVTGDSLCVQLRMMKPLSEAFPEDFAEMEKWAANNARNASIPESKKVESTVSAEKPRRRAIAK